MQKGALIVKVAERDHRLVFVSNRDQGYFEILSIIIVGLGPLEVRVAQGQLPGYSVSIRAMIRRGAQFAQVTFPNQTLAVTEAQEEGEIR